MGSLISVGETSNLCDFSDGSCSSFTISDEALIKLSKPAASDTSSQSAQILMMDVIKGAQSENFVKKMRCLQNEHSKKVGLTMEQIECLLKSLSEHTKSGNQVAVHEEKELVECIKQENSLLACEGPANKYLKTIDEQANRIAIKNSKDVKIDTSVFS